MRRHLSILLVLTTIVAVAPVRAATYDCAPPRCEEIAVPVPEGLKVPDNHVRVLLPRDYATSGKRYPILYLLHGAGDTFKSWTEQGGADDLTRALDLIVVMPDSGHGTNAGWYSDWKDGSRQWESFHIGVMIPFIESTYRTLGDGHRAIAGLSMGGYGTMHYSARYPGKFAAAAAFSGAVDMMFAAPASGVFFTSQQSSGLPDDRVWGNQMTDEANWRANNPTDLAAKLAGMKILIATGNGTPGGAHDPATPNPSSSFVEWGVWEMAHDFDAALDKAGVAHTDLYYGPGDHSWPYWHDDLAWALPQLLATIA